MAMAKQIRQLSAQQTRIEAKLDKVLELLAARRDLGELNRVEPVEFLSAAHIESITGSPAPKPAKPAAPKKPIVTKRATAN